MRFTKLQFITMGALILALFFNPMSYEILKNYIEWGFNIIALVCTVWVVGFLLYKVLKPEQVNIKPKSKKSVVKSKEYLDIDQ